MVDIDNQFGVDIEVHTLISGEACVNVLRYFCLEAAPIQDTPTNFLAAWETQCRDNWLDCISMDASITLIKATPTTPSGQGYTIYPTAFNFTIESGNVAAESLPPQASYRIYKSPATADQSPASPVQVWRNGMIRIPGVPETFQSGGIVNGTGAFALGLLTVTLPDLTVGSNDYQMYHKRVILGVPYYVPTDFCFAGGVIGSQNSRKIVP